MLSKSEIEKIVQDDLERALTQFRETSKQFKQMVNSVPSGLPHPDGSLRIEQASAAYQKAIADLQTALHRHNNFFLHGIAPDDLGDDSPPKRNAVDGAPD